MFLQSKSKANWITVDQWGGRSNLVHVNYERRENMFVNCFSYPCCRNSKIKCLHVRKRDLFEFVNWSIGVSMKRSTHIFCFSWPENVHPRQVLIKLFKSGKQTLKGVRSAFRPRFTSNPAINILTTPIRLSSNAPTPARQWAWYSAKSMSNVPNIQYCTLHPLPNTTTTPWENMHPTYSPACRLMQLRKMKCFESWLGTLGCLEPRKTPPCQRRKP